MNASQFSTLTILLFYTIACTNKNRLESTNDHNIKDSSLTINTVVSDTFEKGKVIADIFCRADTSQSYALYLPATGNNETLPVIYFFDPHGNGAFPLVKYKALADIYNFILIGSNTSKNGNDFPTNEKFWSVLFDDSKKRLKINPKRIYTCGFSGGAKVAGYVALNHNEVKGVIANGAGLPDATPIGNFNFSFTAITGEGDMNMTDLVVINNELDKTKTRHRIIFFEGKHEWAPRNIMDIAFTGLQLDAMSEKIIPRNEAFINNYISKSKKRVVTYSETRNYIKAEQECSLSASLLDGLTSNVNWYNEEDASLKSNPLYQTQWQAKQKLFITEQNMKALYEHQFQQGDINYWVKTVNELETKAKSQTSEGAMNQRLLAYLSLAFYSISNRLITGNQDEQAKYFVDLYKMTDSANQEAWYFSAILNARNNNPSATEKDLLKAVEYGFTDKNRIAKQSEFQNLGTQINFSKTLSKMKYRK